MTYAWSRNCYKVMLLTGRKNEATYRFYESAGFDRHAKQAFTRLLMLHHENINTMSM